jgi:hypothetical protein
MEVQDLAKQLEGKKWQQMIGILNKYSLEIFTEGLTQAQSSFDKILAEINKDV